LLLSFVITAGGARRAHLEDAEEEAEHPMGSAPSPVFNGAELYLYSATGEQPAFLPAMM